MRPDDRLSVLDELRILRAATCDPRLARGDLAVLAVILQHFGRNGTAFPGKERIGQKAMLAPRNVLNATAKLEATGWLRIERRGQRVANVYRLGWKAEAAPSGDTDDTSTSIRSGDAGDTSRTASGDAAGIPSGDAQSTNLVMLASPEGNLNSQEQKARSASRAREGDPSDSEKEGIRRLRAPARTRGNDVGEQDTTGAQANTLPPGTDPAAWAAFEAHHREQRRWSIARAELAKGQLRALAAAGRDPTAVLIWATVRGLADLADAARRMAADAAKEAAVHSPGQMSKTMQAMHILQAGTSTGELSRRRAAIQTLMQGTSTYAQEEPAVLLPASAGQGSRR